MKYVIYELKEPALLTETVVDGYSQKTIRRNALERLDVWGVEEVHSTIESAVAEIKENGEKLKGMNLTILPIVRVSYDGLISTF